MYGYDGPTLRSIRENANVSLRMVARAAGMSLGHMSKVERGEFGQPVTHAVLRGYERACGVTLTGGDGRGGNGARRPGDLSSARLRTFNAKIAAIAIGGQLGEQVNRILDSTGPIPAPVRVDDPDEAAVAQATGSAAARQDAQHHLAQAVADLGADRRRAAALCQARLATGYLEAGELEPGTSWARSAVEAATGVRSARLVHHLAGLRAAAASHANEPAMRELVADIDTTTSPARSDEASGSAVALDHELVHDRGYGSSDPVERDRS